MADTLPDEAGSPAGPLVGLRVVEFGQIIAGPMAGTLMGDLGAEVVHVEQPVTGDAHRHTGPAKDGVSLWWKVASRNKRSVTLNMSSEEGQQIAHELVAWCDVAIVNLRTPTVNKWQLDWESLHAANPRLIMLQISGFGLGTTRSDEPGFGKMAEARSGAVHVTGFGDGPPVHAGFSHGDTTTALMGAFGVMAALHRRNTHPDFDGEWVDLALFETLFRMVEWQIIVPDQTGVTPQRAGNQLAVAPAAVINTYCTRDERWLTITSATLRSVLNVVRMIGLDESEYQTWDEQTRKRDVIDAALRGWVAERCAEECIAEMRKHQVTGELVLSADDILHDEIYAQRDDIISVPDPDLGPVRMQNVVPKYRGSPGAVWRTGPALGADNSLVYQEWLEFSDETFARLFNEGVI